MQIYVSGAFLLQGQGFNNPPPNTAANVQIWGCGVDTSDWVHQGQNDSWLTIYAPNHDLLLQGQGDKNGSFVGQSVLKQGNGDLTYDLALLNLGGNVTVVPGSWAELSR